MKSDLANLLDSWLLDELPKFRVCRWTNHSHGIAYKRLGYVCAEIHHDRVKLLMDGELEINAADPKLLPLLWNRLHSLQKGFDKAVASLSCRRKAS